MKHLKEKQLIAYLFKLLSKNNSRRIRQHLDGCSRCRADLENLRVRFAMLDQARSEPTLEPELIAKTIAALSAKKRPRPYLGYFSALAAAAVILITISLIVFYQPGQTARTPEVAFETSEDVGQAAEPPRILARESQRSVTRGLGRISPDSKTERESFSLSVMALQPQAYVQTFAKAFTDPDVFIGVFESPGSDASASMGTRQSQALSVVTKAGQVRLKLSETIQGSLGDEITLAVSTVLAEQSQPDGLRILPDSRWILVLAQTSGETYDIEPTEPGQRPEIADEGMLFFLHHGGSLCIGWPDEVIKPHGVVEVSKDIVDDFKIIAGAVSEMAEDKPGPERINTVAESLQTDQARAIFEKIVSGKSFE